MVRLIGLDAPDVVALQEVPLWALGRLKRWSGMQVVWAVTVPSFVGPIARLVTDLDPVRVRFALAGQANALLVNPHFELAGHKVLVLNPEVSRLDWIRHGRQRRVCQAVDLRAGDREFVVANLHATNNPKEAAVEAGVAAEFVAPAERCILCGDFNVPRFAVPGFSPAIDGIDQIFVRGLTIERGPEPWPAERRRVGDLLLSDHPPIEAVLSWS
jgi:endonuclease/exonuclease/phosphatase family metal-dependent hydrolase